MIWINDEKSKVHSKKYPVLWQECGKPGTNARAAATLQKYCAQFRILDLLAWTTMVAILCASYLLAPLIDPPNHRWIHAILFVCMIASAPFAFIVSLIRQRITSSRMWTSFLFTLLVSSWLGFLSAVILMATGNFPGTGGIVCAGMGIILSMLISIVVPCFISSLRFKVG